MTLQFSWPGLQKIISGGQTGADVGGLLAAWDYRVQTGGTAPSFYRIDGGHNPLLEVLGLVEGGNYLARTRKNVIDSDGTVIIAQNPKSAGSKRTIDFCKDENKPVLVLDILSLMIAAQNGSEAEGKVIEMISELGEQVFQFVLKNQISILNVAGNREPRPYGITEDKLPMTNCTRFIIGCALDKLNLSGKLIRP